MPLSPEIDQRIRLRFNELETRAKQLVDKSSLYLLNDKQYTSDYHRLRTNFLSLIEMLTVKKGAFSDLIKDVRSVNEQFPEKLHGMIVGLKSDYESGILHSIAEMIEMNVVADYLTQAEQLLKGSKDGVHTYGPAAVLAGAVLEGALRSLCVRQTPPISVNKPSGQPKTMGILIDTLKNVNLFNELKAKQLRAWADIRNAAAHGKFDDFTKEDVGQLISGVKNFLADYL